MIAVRLQDLNNVQKITVHEQFLLGVKQSLTDYSLQVFLWKEFCCIFKLLQILVQILFCPK